VDGSSWMVVVRWVNRMWRLRLRFVVLEDLLVYWSPGRSDDNFDIFEWYPRYQSCQRYFLDHAQHSILW
jgi:hypothetical protein